MADATINRLGSLDALRGLDMAIIIGLDGLTYALAAQFPESPFWQGAREQMGHVWWEGLALYDVIFPLFVFLAGVSMFLSQRKRRAEGSNSWRLAGKLWKRALILVVLGWIVNGALEWDLDRMRYASVLGLIGISCAAAGSIALAVRRVWAVALCAALLLGGVWAAQHWGGDMTPEGCVNAAIDAAVCPGILHYGSYDPEGPLCLVSATALALLGWLAGRSFTARIKAPFRALGLIGVGAALVFAGFQGEVIKNIWTPAFVLSSAGISCIALGVFHLLMEGCGLRGWAFPLRVIGLNALFIYVLTHIIPFSELNARLFGGSIRHLVPETWQPVALNATCLLLAWLVCFAMYRRKIFIKI